MAGSYRRNVAGMSYFGDSAAMRRNTFVTIFGTRRVL
jgi:hypothetical protein